ncbi:hypothetical protein TYRP_022377 [Tyrophagus putrescentiae]|nr:hypothetical protein TYRP_022377 [Tyrophagus putrescentiae]
MKFFIAFFVFSALTGAALAGSNFWRSTMNFERKHGSPPLTLDPEISTWAQQWADHLASTNAFQHRPHNKYGENLYSSWSSAGTPHEDGGKGVQDWYDEIKDYGHSTFGHEPSMSHFSRWGHFTQVVWKASKTVGVGCGVTANKAVVVGNYSPPGNMVGSFKENVPAPHN